MTRRLLTAAVATAAVLLTAGPALAVDDDTTAPATTTAAPTTAAPTSGIPNPVTLLDILEALYGDGVLDGCCGTQPTPQPSPGYVPPPNTLTPPPSASPRFTPVPAPTYAPGPVVPGGGTGAGVPRTTAAPVTTTSTVTPSTAVPPAAASTCVPNAVRGSAGYSVIDDPDGDGVSCTPPRPAGYADPPPIGPQGIPLSTLLAAVAAALALGAALVYRPRLRGRHRPARKG